MCHVLSEDLRIEQALSPEFGSLNEARIADISFFQLTIELNRDPNLIDPDGKPVVETGRVLTNAFRSAIGSKKPTSFL